MPYIGLTYFNVNVRSGAPNKSFRQRNSGILRHLTRLSWFLVELSKETTICTYGNSDH